MRSTPREPAPRTAACRRTRCVRECSRHDRRRAAAASDHGHGLPLAGRFRRGALHLLRGLLLEALALELGKIVDEELPLEVIHLVLDADREQSLGLKLERLAVAVERSNLDLRGPLDVVV